MFCPKLLFWSLPEEPPQRSEALPLETLSIIIGDVAVARTLVFSCSNYHQKCKESGKFCTRAFFSHFE